MHTYELIDAITFRGGRFLLSDEQLRRRRYVVNVVEGNLVEPRSEISFKRGELVTTDHVLPKALDHKAKLLPPTHAAQVPVAEEQAAAGDPESDDQQDAGSEKKRRGRR